MRNSKQSGIIKSDCFFMPKLVKPSVKYKKGFLEDFLPREVMTESYDTTNISKGKLANNFPEFIKRLNLQSEGEYLKPGYVNQTIFWLADGSRYLGEADVRHQLNGHLKKIGGHIGYYIRPNERQKGYGKLILKLALKKAKSLGIENVVITCDITNLGSKKIIESNGGKFEAKVNMGKGLPKKLRFKIKLGSS